MTSTRQSCGAYLFVGRQYNNSMAKILSIIKRKHEKQERPKPANAHQSCGVKILAPAKINLFLEVTNRRKDGYHNIESIMQTVSLFDEITIKPAPNKLTLKCNSKNYRQTGQTLR